MIKRFLKTFFPMFYAESEPERARDDRGRLVGDDKSTPTVNEAWVGGQAPEPKKPKRYEPRLTATAQGRWKKPAPKKRGRPKGSKNKTTRSKK